MVRASVVLTCVLGAIAVAGCGNRANTLPDFESGSAGAGGGSGASTSPFGEGAESAFSRTISGIGKVS